MQAPETEPRSSTRAVSAAKHRTCSSMYMWSLCMFAQNLQFCVYVVCLCVRLHRTACSSVYMWCVCVYVCVHKYMPEEARRGAGVLWSWSAQGATRRGAGNPTLVSARALHTLLTEPLSGPSGILNHMYLCHFHRGSGFLYSIHCVLCVNGGEGAAEFYPQFYPKIKE